MSVQISINPQGRLELVADEPAEKYSAAFEESSAAGLLFLASPSAATPLPPTLVFWREYAQQLLRELCKRGEGATDEWKSVPPPTDAELAELIAAAPAMRGLEYLTATTLKNLWAELRELVVTRANKFRGGPAAYLHSIYPLWHLLGRVTFHLAENKKDPQRPFAFLATFTHGLSGASKVQHLPLAEALRTYAGAKDQAQLAALLEPVRRAAEGSELVRELVETKAVFSPQAWPIRQAHRFLSEVPRMEAAGVVVRVPNWWSARSPPRPQVQVRIGAQASSAVGLDSLLDFHVGLAFDGEPLTAAERDAILQGTDELMLLRGKWVEVDRARLEQALTHWKTLERAHEGGIGFIDGMRLLAGVKLDDASPQEERVVEWSHVTAGNWLRETLENLRQGKAAEDCRPGRDLQATLRPYQADGVRWLWFLTELGLGACLADDMGLGKTIQIIDFLLQRKRAAGKSPPRSLLIVPATLLGNWKAELERFAPSLKVFFAHRAECDAETLVRIDKNPAAELAGVDLVITTYGLVRRQKWPAELKWSLVILDEAQAIKNAGSTQTRSVKALQAAGRIVLTGTPVENQLGDLWSLFDFCCPGLLGNASQFKRFVNKLQKQQDAGAFGPLRQLVRPYILRRMKTDPAIVSDLPEKTEMRTECGLTKKQAALYERAVKDLKKQLDEAEGIARRGLVLASLLKFKQICNHPDQLLHSGKFAPEESGKFERLRLLCEPIVERQEKVLIFTQFQSLTQPLADYLATVFGGEGLVLHGGTPVKKRGELVQAFQNDPRKSFFVISLKAGGSGLNLTAASHVVHFDRWWNPAVENQATDRAFRIGQKRNVLVHKFVCRGTVEEQIDSMIRDKQALADQMLSAGDEVSLTEMSDERLLQFVALDLSRAVAE